MLDDPVRAQLPDNPISQPPAQPMSATLIGIPAALAGLAAAGYGLSSTRARRPQSQSLRGAALLLTDQRSSYLTGVILPVDGGWTAH